MNIYETKQVVDSIEAMQKMSENLQQNIGNVKEPLTKQRMHKLLVSFLKIAVVIYLIAIVALTVFFICDEWYSSDSSAFEALIECIASAAFLCGIPVVIIGGIVFAVIWKLYDKKEANRELSMQEQAIVEKYIREIKEIEFQITQKRECLLASEVPARYHHSVMLNLMIEFIENKRADTLKEAINLLEQFADEERRHRELVESQGDTYYIVK